MQRKRKLPGYQKSFTFKLIRGILPLGRQSITQVKSRILKEASAKLFWDSYQQILLSYLGSFLGIAVLTYLTIHSGYPLIAAPFGATAVLVFAVPDSPMAQPRNVIGGSCIAAITCVSLVQLFGSEAWVMALAVATAIKLMQLTRTLHPPGGAIALLGVTSQASWDFVWTPILAGSLVLVFCTIIFNNLVSGKPYPKHWF
jgi:CBS-domain-containing membrane protein